MIKPPCSNFRGITAKFSGVRILQIFTVDCSNFLGVRIVQVFVIVVAALLRFSYCDLVQLAMSLWP